MDDTLLATILNPFTQLHIPIGVWVENLINWLVTNFHDFFHLITLPIDRILEATQTTLMGIPPLIFILAFWLLAWQVAGLRSAILPTLALIFIGLFGAWDKAMVTLSLIITAVFFCIIIGIPLGVVAARNDKFEISIRPILDAMQTTPAFVYLVPVVMLFGVGNVPGVIVTIIFALPPLIRLTNLGLRQVSPHVIEAALAFGASKTQLLFKVQLPLATRTIMAGLNQTLMMSLAMVVIGSMIAVGGLGQMVLRGIGRLDMALATVGGIGIVLMAISLDRLTQALSRPPREKKVRHWYQQGPVALVVKAFSASRASEPPGPQPATVEMKQNP
jgi:glycine betaine/proline transport system permease protein